MCLKRVYYNTYGDGSEDVTERVDTCRPGKMCSSPEVRKYERKFRFTKLEDPTKLEPASSLADRKPTPYHAEPHIQLPPTPDTSEEEGSGAQSAASASRKPRSRSPGTYVNGIRIADVSGTRGRAAKRYSHVSHTREPSPPRPKLKRHSTTPASGTVVVQQDRQPRGRERASSRRDRSRDVAVGPFSLCEDLGRRSSRDRARDESPPRRRHHHPHDSHHSKDHKYQAERPAPPPPSSSSASSVAATKNIPKVNIVFVDDEREARRMRRAKERRHTYDDAVDGKHSSTTFSHRHAAHGDDEPARKSLRWQDEVEAERAAQNARIASRSKTAAPIVKGILKHATGTDAATTRERSGSGSGSGGPKIDDLRRAVRGMDIPKGKGKGAGAGGRPRAASGSAREDGDGAYYDRLRGRFDLDPRGEGRERQRRSRVYYPGEGLYKYV